MSDFAAIYERELKSEFEGKLSDRVMRTLEVVFDDDCTDEELTQAETSMTEDETALCNLVCKKIFTRPIQIATQ